MEPNKLEQEFRDKLEQRTIQPSQMAWDRLDAMLSVNEQKEENTVVSIKKPRNKNWMYMAASFIVFATIGTFFLTRESGIHTESNGNSVVNTEKPVETEGNNDMVRPSGVQSAVDNISAPTINSEAVASNGKAVSKQKSGSVPVATQAKPGVVSSQSVEHGIAEVSHENMKVDTPKDVEEGKLLADNNSAPKKKAPVKVDANSLLSSVEGELNENFRDKAFDGVVKNFNAVKSAVANRNYQ